MIFFSAKQNRKMQATFLDNRRKIGDVNTSLQDSLAGIRIVQSFANEDIEREKFRVGNEAFLDSKRDNYRAMGSFQSGNTFFQGMMYLVTLLYQPDSDSCRINRNDPERYVWFYPLSVCY